MEEYPKDTPRTNKFEESCGDYEKPYAYARRLAKFARNLEREASHYRKTLENILSGEYPKANRPGECAHSKYWYEECEQCIDDYIGKQLGEDLNSPQSVCKDNKSDEQKNG